jgi:hypothetical protein
MENKIYTYNCRQYRMGKFDLGLLNKAAPLLLKYRKLLYEYTKDIDLAEVNEAEERITELKTAIEQLGEAGNKTETERLTEKLRIEEEAFGGNARLQSALKLYNDCTGLALYSLITDGETLNPFLNGILECVTGKEKFQGLDMNDTSSINFAREVLGDFLACTLRSSLKLKG